jgi:hypothetical protein
MESVIIWPEQPLLSLFAIWLLSVIFLWAAREPMRGLIQSLGGGLDQGLRAIAEWCRSVAAELRKRSRASLLAAGSLDAQARLDREFHRIDTTFSESLGKYSKLHRRLDDLLLDLDTEHRKCGEAPPEVPGWTAAVETIAGIPMAGDPNIQKVLEGIKKSSQDAERKALQAYRDDTARRHKTLGGMAPHWKVIRSLMGRMQDSVSKALESIRHIDGYVDEYQKIRDDQDSAARALNYSATKLFFIALLVLGVALGGAFVNFQLIALPMSELVPAGARIGDIPVSTVSALVIVLMEAAVGIFIMEMLGITDLFPKLAGIPSSRRRLILGLCLGGLFFLASVESSLAVLREQIVEADAALKLSLAGPEAAAVHQASSSLIPVVGQAVLGFVLPWILAMVAIPLEMLLDSGRHVAAALMVLLLQAAGTLAAVVGHLSMHLTKILVQIFDVYISIPLRLERMLRSQHPERQGEVAA